MLDAEYDLTAIGLPFIDIIAQVDDSLLQKYGLAKGSVRDLPSDNILAIRGELTNYTIVPGGSASNTAAGVQALGGKAGFLGRICDDNAGRTFRTAFATSGVVFPNKPLIAGPRATSGVVIVMMTPDGATTIVACPGVGDHLTEADIFSNLVATSEILLLQSHFLLLDSTRPAALKAIEAAKSGGRTVALSMHGHRLNAERTKVFTDSYLPMGDIILGNKSEFSFLFRPLIVEDLKGHDKLLVMTDGANGAYIMGHGELIHIPPYRLKIRDNSVGAGDAYAAGFFFGYARGLPLQLCGELGAETASEIMELPGARPTGSWQSIADKYLTKAPTAFRKASDLTNLAEKV